MRDNAKSRNAPGRRLVAVDWQDCAWQPSIEVRNLAATPRRPGIKSLAVPPLDFHSPRKNFILPKTMKKNPSVSRRRRAGFTLVELLTVIAIIGILAALLLPVLSAVKKSAQRTKAKLEANDIATAIQTYDSDYGRFPTSQNPGTGDFTYGGMFQSPSGSQSVGTVVSGSIISNAEVIAILMDLTNYPGGGPTVNTNYQKNPQQHVFLRAKTSGDNSSPGVGNDLVYRDPWGNPYVISMDLNYNDFCVDAFYGKDVISSTGLFGLIRDTSVAAPNNWAYRGKVMVWSAGPDGMIDPNNAAGAANKDNVLNWQ